ncbi:MAG TPA: hypothetical protein VGB44_00625 [Flavobacterium sp.]
MTSITVLLLVLSVLLAGGLSFFQYFFRTGTRSRINVILASLRFISIFGLLLLLINPIISRKSYETEKTPLPLVVDNSGSIEELNAGETASEVYRKLSSNSDLQKKFDIQSYKFDASVESADQFDFKGQQSNLEAVAKNLKSVNKNKKFPTILITDGNQTTGNDFVFAFDQANKVYPLVLGDTTTFLDLKISRLNVNKYAFYKNKFPVEVFLQYAGTKSVNANFSISLGKNVVAKQSVSFSPNKKTAVINLLLPADRVGLQVYRASITSSETEKNSYNNHKNFAVEVIDQKTEVAIVTIINHPDISALRRSIESNAQRRVSILKPTDVRSVQDYDIVILYQPTAAFKPLFDANKNVNVNSLIITGMNTDFDFLNREQQMIGFRMSGQSEDYLADFNTSFNLFALDNIGLESLPPLQHPFGNFTVGGGANVLLSSRIRNITTGAPLLAFFENQNRRNAFLLGENIWKWRLQSHIETNSFEQFDIFIDKTIQYLASNNKRRSLVVNHERFYNSGDPIEITAQFFNKNYEFDEKARLTITITEKTTKQTRRYDMLRGANSYKANLDGLPAGNYNFQVRELNSNTTFNGAFDIMEFNIEKQFVNPDLQKLNQLASQTNGASFMPNQVDELIKSLLENDEYKAIQKEVTKKTPLIDWLWLLAIIVLSLAAEWFTRKYNGML